MVQDIRLKEMVHILMAQPLYIQHADSEYKVLVDWEKDEDIPTDMLDMYVLLAFPYKFTDDDGNSTQVLSVVVSE